MSDKKINLLPKERQQQLRLRSWYRVLVRFYAFTVSTLLVVLCVYIGVWVYLKSAERSLKQEEASLRAQANAQTTTDLKKQIKGINNQITDYNTLSAAVPKWSALLKQLAGLVPSGVYIQRLNVDSSQRQVTIYGTAPTRDLVIRLYDNIAEDTTHFTNIDYPLENVSRPTAVNFHFTFTVKEKVLQ